MYKEQLLSFGHGGRYFTLQFNNDNSLVSCDLFIDQLEFHIDNSSFNSLLRMINELGVLLHIQSFPYLIVFPFSSSSYHSRNQ